MSPSTDPTPEARRIGVLGTLVLDTIRRPGEPEPTRSLGGISYSLAAFEAVRPAGWEALPLMKVGEDATEEARALLDALDGVRSREGVVAVAAPNNRVELVYDGRGERDERLSGGVPGWEWAELEPLVGSCDALYVNLIAGWELDLEGARRTRAGFSGPTYCDLHSLFLDRGSEGPRTPRAPEGWRGWFEAFDYVQTNRGELTLLADDADRPPWSLARELAEVGPRAIFVTLGPDGAAWVTARGGGDPAAGRAGAARGQGPADEATPSGRLAPPRRVGEGDPTGCGDVWGMTCFTGLLEGRDVRSAVGRANSLACRNASCEGGLGLLERDLSERSGRDGARGGERSGPDGAGA